MKKLFLLTIIVSTSLTAFSQKDIKPTTDSVVTLPKIVAIQVVKDIIKKDSCEAELITTKKNYTLLEDNNRLKDSIITSKVSEIKLAQQKEKNYETMLVLKDTEKKNVQQLVDRLNDDLKSANKKLAKTQVGAGAIIFFLMYVIIK